MHTAKQVSARKLTILLMLSVPDASGRPNQPLTGTTRIQKLAFLVQEKCQLALKDSTYFRFDFNYEPEKFGPADLDLYQDLDFLRAMRLIMWEDEMVVPSEEPSLESMVGTSGVQMPTLLPEEREEEELSFEYLIGVDSVELLAADAEREGERQYSITVDGLAIIDKIRTESSGRQKDHFVMLEQACAEVRKHFGDWPLKRLLKYVYDNYESMTSKSTIREKVKGTF